MMSSNQTNQANPGDSATDLTPVVQDETNEHTDTFGGTGYTALAPNPTAGTNDEPNDDGDALFPGQTADEQNLEVDVCCLTGSKDGYLLDHAEKRLTLLL